MQITIIFLCRRQFQSDPSQSPSHQELGLSESPSSAPSCHSTPVKQSLSARLNIMHSLTLSFIFISVSGQNKDSHLSVNLLGLLYLRRSHLVKIILNMKYFNLILVMISQIMVNLVMMPLTMQLLMLVLLLFSLSPLLIL